MHALISVHDVMPHTLARVQGILRQMEHLDAGDITLLVVPGLNWDREKLDSLRALENRGYVLAGHGWEHTTRHIRGFYHRLHSSLVSRNAAEHLALSEGEIRQLMRDCYSWFAENGLREPDLYVPPAWAMGKINKSELKTAPFRYFENTAGLYDSETDTQYNLPLAGFEADNLFRFCSLKFWNGLNKTVSSGKRPLRLSIHPYDTELLLEKSLQQMLRAVTNTVHYRSVL